MIGLASVDTLTGVTAYFDAGATVTATLYDIMGNEVPGCTGITLSYIPGSFGNFQGLVLGSAFNPPIGSGYKLIINAQEGQVPGKWTLLVEVKERNQ